MRTPYLLSQGMFEQTGPEGNNNGGEHKCVKGLQQTRKLIDCISSTARNAFGYLFKNTS